MLASSDWYQTYALGSKIWKKKRKEKKGGPDWTLWPSLSLAFPIPHEPRNLLNLTSSKVSQP